MTSGNDLLGNGLGNGDDFRTAAIGGHLRLGGMVLAVDASMLTDRDAGTRSDELLAIAGWSAQRAAPVAGWHAAGFLGAGVRVDGDLGGEKVQNAVHEVIASPEVHFPYDDGRVLPALGGSGAVGWLEPAGLGLTGWWGMQLVAAGQWAIGGEFIGEAGPRLCLIGQQGAIWVGARVRWRDGDPAGPTVAATGEHEDGPWLDLGTFVTPFGDSSWGYQLRSAYNPDTRAAFGSLGLVVDPGVAPPGPELALEHDLAAYDGGGFGVQLRWHPWPWQDTGRRCAAVLDYRFGGEPDGFLELGPQPGGPLVGAELRHDQFTIGWEEGVRSPDWSGLRFVPWFQVAAGVRTEGVVVQGSGARSGVGDVTAPMVGGSAGVRLVWSEVVSLGGSIDGWLPWWSQDLLLEGERIELNDPGWTVGVHLAAHIAW